MPKIGTSSANGVTEAAEWRLSIVIQIPKPSSVLGPTTKSSAATPAGSIPASASPTSPGPSKRSERPSSGSGGTRLAQTSSASPSGAWARRVRTLATPQASAAATISAKGRIGALAARSTPIAASPANAIPAPIS